MDPVSRRAARRAKARADRTCPVCAGLVEARRSTRRYCSTRCRVAAHRAKTGGRSKTAGLRPAQVRILAALDGRSWGLTRAGIAAAAGVSVSWLSDHVGRLDPVKRAAREARIGHVSLLTLGCVKIVECKVEQRGTVRG
jgi:hypothetical protein